MNDLEKMKKFFLWRKSYSRPHMTVLEKPHMNAIYVKRGESWDHALKKFEISFKHIQDGHKIITEAQRLVDGDIPDIVCFECGEIEIINTNGNEDEYKQKGRIVFYTDSNL